MRLTLAPHTHLSWQTTSINFSNPFLKIKTQVLVLFSIMWCK